MSQQILLEMFNRSGDIVQCTLSFSSRPPWIIEFYSPTIGQHHSSGDDLFESLSNLRSKLEQLNWFIMCFGSRIDTYPSRMSRQMSGGKKLYLLKMGEPANEQNLVDTFEATSAEKIGTLAEQLAYYRQWLNSLK
jgi:hypothetical protein